jgi:hypothetical protein
VCVVYRLARVIIPPYGTGAPWPQQSIDISWSAPSLQPKTRWLAAAAENNWLCAFAHDPAIDFARIVKHPKTGFATTAPGTQPDPASPLP